MTILMLDTNLKKMSSNLVNYIKNVYADIDFMPLYLFSIKRLKFCYGDAFIFFLFANLQVMFVLQVTHLNACQQKYVHAYCTCIPNVT